MTLSSMTAYARTSGVDGDLHWQWEMKSVNGKGLDVRLRMGAGCDALEAPLLELARKALRRGNLQITLICTGGPSADVLTINEPLLDHLIVLGEAVRTRTGAPPMRVEALFALRGVLDFAPAPETDAQRTRREACLTQGFVDALESLIAMRHSEGRALRHILEKHLSHIEALTQAARHHGARTPEAVRARLAEQMARLLEAHDRLDTDRLYQEAALLATRADMTEELDRLDAHVVATRALLKTGGEAGRKLDFLAQEFNREANTLCSKSSDSALTAIGLDLRATIDQLREQIANIE